MRLQHLDKCCKDETMTNAEHVFEIEAGAKRLEQANSFLYLGCRVTKDAERFIEVKIQG